MPTDHRNQLRQIRNFPQLIKYLQEELDWPIDDNSFDDLTFDYEPEDLGIDPKTSAKIRKIRQLRPLVTDQPWGIFFVQFGPKRLPVVALRRILGQLVFKQRASANRAERPSWNLHDLLFVSAYGEGDAREISLAHFSDDSQMGDLATLRVLGYDRTRRTVCQLHEIRSIEEVGGVRIRPFRIGSRLSIPHFQQVRLEHCESAKSGARERNSRGPVPIIRLSSYGSTHLVP